MQGTSSIAQSEPTATELSLFALLLLVDSLHFVFARALLPYLAPGVSAMYVLCVSVFEIGTFGLIRRQLRPSIARANLLFFLVLGLLVATSTVLNYEAVAFIDAGTAAMLGKMSVVYSLGLGLIWLRDRLRPIQIAGGLLAIAGVFTVAFQPGDYLRFGSLLIVFSTFLYALHAAVVKRHGDKMDFINFFFFRLLFTSGFLFLFALVRQSLVWPTAATWRLLLLAGTVDVTISRGLYYLALRRLPMSIHSIVLTLSPVVAIFWALLLFETFPKPQQLIGGSAVLVGVLLTTFRAPR